MVEATEFRVFITGLILLTAQELYDNRGGGDIGAALAIAVEERTGSYDVDIPSHDAELVLEAPDFALDPNNNDDLLIKGTDKDRINAIDVDASKQYPRVVALKGDRIRFGQYKRAPAPECEPFESDEAADASSGTLKQVPRFSQLGIKKSALRDDSKPVSGDFKDVSRERLAAWLELSGGRLKIKRKEPGESKQELPMAEFRPSRHAQRIAPVVLWRRETDDDRRGCVIIDPFKDNDPEPNKPDIVLFLKSNAVKITYRNLADKESGEDHELAAYDFEMFYRVLNEPPSVPPLPYYRSAHHGATAEGPQEGEVGTTSVIEGVNCGPARVP